MLGYRNEDEERNKEVSGEVMREKWRYKVRRAVVVVEVEVAAVA